jgi:hypothetical protein
MTTIDPYRQGVELNDAYQYTKGIIKIHNEHSDYNGNHQVPYFILGQTKTSHLLQTDNFFRDAGKFSSSSTTINESWSYPPLSITNVNPSSGSIAGGFSVEVTGSGFTYMNGFSINSSAVASFNIVSNTVYTFTAPAKDVGGYYSFTIRNNVNSFTLNNAFTYYGIPTITTTSRTIGNLEGGDLIYITGSNLVLTSEITFGGVAATNISEVSDSILSCYTPAHATGLVDITVTTPGGVVTSSNAYKYWDPTVLGINWYVEEPDYFADNVGMGSGTWTAKVGPSVGRYTSAPYSTSRGNPSFRIYTSSDNDSLEYLNGSTQILGALRTLTSTADATYVAIIEHTGSIRGSSATSFSNEAIFSDFPVYQGMFLGGTSSDQAYLYRWDTAEKKVNTTIGTNPGYSVIVGKILSGAMLMKVNTGSWVTGSTGVGAPSATSTNSAFLIGRQTAAATFYAGEMYMLGVDSRAWTDTECDDFYRWAIQQHPRQY